jgi:hypothetical protein
MDRKEFSVSRSISSTALSASLVVNSSKCSSVRRRLPFVLAAASLCAS